MIVSIDFDDTWTKDPEGWRMFARMMVARGHTVIVTTNRIETSRSRAEVYMTISTRSITNVVFAGEKPKRVAAAERGYQVDIWIDDSPEMVVWGNQLPPAERCGCRRFRTRPTLTGHRAGCVYAVVG